MKKQTAILKEWRLDFNLTGNTFFLHGVILKDEAKRFKDDTKIRTSKVLKMDLVKMTAETKNTIYQLKDMGYNF